MRPKALGATPVPPFDRFARALAIAGVVTASLALAILWVYLVPMLEASDESEHFDYVVSLAHAGRLIAADNAAPYPSYDYDTSFLQTYTAFSRLSLLPHDRVPPGYGSHEYFQRIDRRSRLQLPDRWTFDPSIHSPALLPFYPFGYYGLAAVWLHLFPAFRDSLVSTFFAARWLSVALLGITLTFAYGIAGELGLRRWLALAFTAIVGMFTLTTFVASYVQPDNLTWAAFSMIVYLALRMKRRLHVGEVALLGAAFGILAITKYQYFLCAAAAVVPFAILRLARSGSAALALGALGLLIFPSVVTFVAQAHFVGANPTFTNTETSHLHFSKTFFPLAWQAFRHFFVAGFNSEIDADPHFSGATTYWGDSGWLDTPITFGQPALDRAARSIIQILNVTVIALTLVWLSRDGFRLARLSRRGRPLRALSLVLSSVPMNAYLVFIAFMISFYALTENSWRMSARLWLPLIVPAFLLGFWYAPRALGHGRWRAGARRLIFCCLALYSTMGSFFATAAVQQRYYGLDALPPLSSLRKGAPVELVVSIISTSQDPPRAPVDSRGNFIGGVRQGQQIEIVGWASDPASRSAAGGVVALIDQRDEVAATYGYATQDVADSLHNFPFFWSGYHFYIPTQNLAFGPHVISFYVISSDFKTAYRATRSLYVIVDPPRPIVIGDHRHIVGSLDQVGPASSASHIGAELDAVWIGRRDQLLLRGWCDDVIHPRAVRRIVVTIDRRRTYDVRLGDLRPELAGTFPHLPRNVAMYSGYSALIPMRDLTPGEHSFSVTAYDGETRDAVRLVDDFAFGVFDDTILKTVMRPPYAELPLSFNAERGIRGTIDFVGTAEDAAAGARQGARFVDRRGSLLVRGWGLKQGGRALEPLSIVVDGVHRYAVRTRVLRLKYVQGASSGAVSDVEAYAGFNVVVPLQQYATGAHRFSIIHEERGTGREQTIVRDFAFAVY